MEKNWAIWLAYAFITYLSLPFIKKFIWPTIKKILSKIMQWINKENGEEK